MLGLVSRESKHRESGGDGDHNAVFVDNILREEPSEDIFWLNSVADLPLLEKTCRENRVPKHWGLRFRKLPPAPVLCAWLGSFVERWNPSSLVVHAEGLSNEATQRFLSILRALLISLDRCESGLRLVACPTCARCKVPLMEYARQVQQELLSRTGSLVVAVMGCEVNGPGEAKAADVGVAFGRGGGLVFRKGAKLRKVPAEEAVAELMREVDRLLASSSGTSDKIH